MPSLFNYRDVKAKTAKPLVINQIIDQLLEADDGACYAAMERYLMPPGVTGSRAFDQAYAVSTLLEYDDKNGRRLAKAMESAPQLTHRVLWDKLQLVLRNAGFKVSHGRLIDLLEQPKADEKENGQPDID